jgi:hypothetical protein
MQCGDELLLTCLYSIAYSLVRLSLLPQQNQPLPKGRRLRYHTKSTVEGIVTTGKAAFATGKGWSWSCIGPPQFLMTQDQGGRIRQDDTQPGTTGKADALVPLVVCSLSTRALPSWEYGSH